MPGTRNCEERNISKQFEISFLELAGTEDVTVTGCTFRGYWQEYEGGGQECIQLDACLDYIFPGYQPLTELSVRISGLRITFLRMCLQEWAATA